MFIITTHSKTNSQSSKKLESHIPYPNSIPFHKSSNLMSDCLTILQLSSRFTLPIALPSIIWQPHLRTCSKQAAASMHQIWTKPRWDTLSRGHVFSFIITSSWLRWEKSHFWIQKDIAMSLLLRLIHFELSTPNSKNLYSTLVQLLDESQCVSILLIISADICNDALPIYGNQLLSKAHLLVQDHQVMFCWYRRLNISGGNQSQATNDMYCNPCQVASSDSLASVMNSVDQQAQTLVTTSLKVLQDPWLL